VRYREFHIRAWQDGPGYARVLVHRSPVGDMREPYRVPFDDALLRTLPTLFDGPFPGLWFADRDRTFGRVAAFGRALAAVLLPPPVLALLVGSLGALREDTGLRVRLCLDPNLIDLPWEFLYRPDVDGEPHTRGFLALDPRVSLVREASRIDDPIPEPDTAERLLYAGTYWSTAAGRVDKWSVKSEYDGVVRALARLQDSLIPTFIRSDEDLAAALAEPAAVFHYTGHTYSEQVTGYLERIHVEPGSPAVRPADARMSSERLATLLRLARTRLAVFSACNSGRWSFVEPLLRNDLRALIGVQEVVSNVGAAAFSDALYSTLASGLSLDEAVSWGRARVAEVDAIPGTHCYEWGAFMAYVTCTDAVLLPRGDRVRDRQGEVRRARDETTRRLSDPLPQSVLVVEALGGLLPGEFATVALGAGLGPADLGGPDQRSQAVTLYRFAERGGKLDLLRHLIRRYRPDGLAATGA
jgi:hypothetical protein